MDKGSEAREEAMKEGAGRRGSDGASSSVRMRLLESGLQGIVGALIAAIVSLVVSYISPQVFNFVIDGEEVDQIRDENSALRDEVTSLKESVERLEGRMEGLAPVVRDQEKADSAVNLLSKKAVDSNRFEMNDETLIDTIGNRYQPGDCALLSYWAPDQYGYVTYYLGGEYSTLGLTIAASDLTRVGIDRATILDILVKTTDSPEYQSIYTSPELYRSIAPVQVDDLDVTDAEWIEFRLGSNSSEIGDSVLAIIADVRLH